MWRDKNVNWVLDGHGRLQALQKMASDGYIIPDLPVTYISCANKKEAKDLLLRMNSSYGRMTKDSVKSFVKDFDLDLSDYQLPAFNIDFTNPFENKPQNTQNDSNTDNDVSDSYNKAIEKRDYVSPTTEATRPVIEEPLESFTFGDINSIDTIVPREIEITESDEEIPVADKDNIDSEYGKIYYLGNHILMCGSIETDIDILFDGNRADITFIATDYNKDTVNNIIKRCLEYTDYVFMDIQSDIDKSTLIDLLHDNKDTYADTIIWDKVNPSVAMHNNVLNSVFDYIHVFSNTGKKTIGTKYFRSNTDNLFHIEKVKNRTEYSDIIPLDTALYITDNFANKSVFVPFGNTGSTLIACEKLGKKCFIMEQNPLYCDIIRKRYSKYAVENNIKDIGNGYLK